MNPFEMVVLIVAISAVASIFRAKYGHTRRRDRSGDPLPLTTPDTDRQAAEITALKERIHVLERIVTDGDRNRSLELEREIDALRQSK